MIRSWALACKTGPPTLRFTLTFGVRVFNAFHAFQRCDEKDEHKDQRHTDQVFLQCRRKNEHITCIFDQRRKARNAKRHEEQPKNLPAIQLSASSTGASCADHQRHSDNRAQSERGEPKTQTGIKITNQHNQVPDEVAPKDEAPFGKVRQVTDQSHDINQRSELIQISWAGALARTVG